MSVYKRYFKATKGPFLAEAKRIHNLNRVAVDEYRKILKSAGASVDYWRSNHRLVAMSFKNPPDKAHFKKVKNGWYPKKTSEKGKKLCARLDAVVTESDRNALVEVGLKAEKGFGGAALFDGGYVYWPTVTYIPKKSRPEVYLVMPWKDIDPKKIKEVLAGQDEDFRDDINYLTWKQPDYLTEVKVWQMEQAVDRFNNRAKS